jgi:DnaJ family protein C protein 16
MIERFKIPTTNVDTLLIFQENVDVPIVSVSTKDITLNTLFEMIEANQFLQLPRLSSQDIFDQLCPGAIRNQCYYDYYFRRFLTSFGEKN